MARPLSVASAHGQSIASSTPSYAALFLRNVRLLDLDLRADWPGITLSVLASRDSDQKQRIRCVEWALFRLFDLWDAEETRDKLQPFFPPLEPLQSLNLRAALYRCLNELKKNGILGRETTLRKTMLDDCKGDKFWEALAVFSAIVVKRHLLGEGQSKQSAVSMRLATSPLLNAKQAHSLLPLAIAHKASLVANLRKRNALKRQYALFADLLDEKSQQLQAREQATLSKPDSKVPNDLAALRQQIDDGWIANSRWVGILLHGEERSSDQVLSQPFDSVWSAVCNGEAFESALPELGLLASLESRVQRQKQRLAHWRDFHSKLDVPAPDASAGRSSAASGLQFDLHQQLIIANGAANGTTTSSRGTVKVDGSYQAIVEAMRQELGRAKASSRPSSSKEQQPETSNPAPSRLRPFRLLPSPRHDFSGSFAKESIKDTVKRPSSSFGPPSPVPGNPHRLPDSFPLSRQVRYKSHFSLPIQPNHPAPPLHSPATDTFQDAGEHDPTSQSPYATVASPMSDGHKASEVAAEQAIVEQIISSVSAPTPARVERPILSLTERTRLSIAHFAPPDDSPKAPNSDGVVASLNRPAPQPRPDLIQGTSLLERTRQSMSLLPDAGGAHRPRKSIIKMTKQRQSLFPVNQFETPRKASMALSEHSEDGAEGDSTPKERLFAEDAEYSSVFKSRPKIASSPPNGTPHDGEMPSMDGVIEYEASFMNSPLARSGLGITSMDG